MDAYETIAMREISDAASLAAQAGDTAESLRLQSWGLNPRAHKTGLWMKSLIKSPWQQRLKNAYEAIK